MRMRTIDEGYKEIKTNDPDTGLSKTAWRRLVITGEIPSVCVGTKRLVNMELAERYLTTGAAADAKLVPVRGAIRRIEG